MRVIGRTAAGTYIVEIEPDELAARFSPEGKALESIPGLSPQEWYEQLRDGIDALRLPGVCKNPLIRLAGYVINDLNFPKDSKFHCGMRQTAFAVFATPQGDLLPFDRWVRVVREPELLSIRNFGKGNTRTLLDAIELYLVRSHVSGEVDNDAR